MFYLCSLAQLIWFCFDLPHIPHTSSLPTLSISTFFSPQASRESPLPPCLIPSTALHWWIYSRPRKRLQKAPVSQVCSVGTLLNSIYYCWPLTRQSQPVGSLAMLVLVALAGWMIALRKTWGLEERYVCMSVHGHTSIATQQQPWLFCKLPHPFLLLNFHFPATPLKRPLAPEYPAGACWNLLRHSSMFSYQFKGENSTYWMAHSHPGKLTNHTENKEGGLLCWASSGSSTSISRRHSGHHNFCSELSGHRWTAVQTVLGWPCTVRSPSAPSLTSDHAAN